MFIILGDDVLCFSLFYPHSRVWFLPTLGNYYFFVVTIHCFVRFCFVDSLRLYFRLGADIYLTLCFSHFCYIFFLRVSSKQVIFITLRVRHAFGCRFKYINIHTRLVRRMPFIHIFDITTAHYTLLSGQHRCAD